MNPSQLLAHFDRMEDAPDAVPRLRRFVLDLAVRGKLVEQDPNDEPTAELLKRIAAENSQGGKKKGSTPLTPLEDETPYVVPSSWVWGRFDEVAVIESNLVKPQDFADYPHIAPDNIEGRTGRLLPYQTIRESKVFSAKHRFFPGQIVYSKIRPALAKATPVDFEGLCSADMYPIRPLIDRGFLLRYMLSEAFVEQSVKEDTRVAMPKINQEALAKILVAVPPLAEQRRIVEKVDELMALCDKLEAAQTERESRRDRLVRASLTRLNQPDDNATTFRDHARFTLDHLPRLVTRPEHVKELRQTILNLAVRGKLVPQDPNDEPAADLLHRVLADVRDYARENRLPSSKHDTVSQVAGTFPAPVNWEWTKLAALCRVVTDGDHLPPPKSDRGVAFLTIGNVTTGRLDFSNCRFVPPEYIEKLPVYRKPAFGDLLYTVVGATYGRPVLVDSQREFCVQRHIAILKPAVELNLRFLFLIMASPFIYDQATRSTTGTAQPTIALRPLRNFLIPLPPLAEQHRIVAKVDELMAVCDQLEAQLTTAQDGRGRLLEAVLHDALHTSDAARG